jgi:hypothetical protein
MDAFSICGTLPPQYPPPSLVGLGLIGAAGYRYDQQLPGT